MSSAIARSTSSAWSRSSSNDIVAAAGILVLAKRSHSDRIAPMFCRMNDWSRPAFMARRLAPRSRLPRQGVGV